MYIICLIITAALAAPLYRLALTLLVDSRTAEHAEVLVAVLRAALSILFFVGLNRLNERVFIKDKNKKEDQLKAFSNKVNTTLKENEIIALFSELVRNEIPLDELYICMFNEESDAYETVADPASLALPLCISRTNPLIDFICEKQHGVLFSDFIRSNEYRSMWESEKQSFERIGVSYVPPFCESGNVMGFALFTRQKDAKEYEYDEQNFLESVGAVASIALKNAHLYGVLEREAQMEMLTNLYSRRYFIKKLNEVVSDGGLGSVSLIMFNLDDFGLYNELYGTEEGDRMLKRFADIMLGIFGSKGTLCRYSRKEFAALLPLTDANTAEQYVQRVWMQLQHQLDSEGKKTKKFLTFSSGICAYPAVASNANELITYVNLAVFRVKQNGKNKTLIYDNDLNREEDGKDKREKLHELTSTIYALTAAVDAKDHYTFNHSRAVSTYATQLAQFAGMPDDFVEIIRQAGLLHDIGKIGIPDAILTKTGKLTDEEYLMMKKHPKISIEMIRHLPALDYVIPAVIGHHEHYDGRGYPRGLSSEDIRSAHAALPLRTRLTPGFPAAPTRIKCQRRLP